MINIAVMDDMQRVLWCETGDMRYDAGPIPP